MCVQLIDWRIEFSKWWSSEFKTIKIPSSGTVFNYFVDSGSKQLRPWSDMVSPFELNPEIPLQVLHEILSKFSKNNNIIKCSHGIYYK